MTESFRTFETDRNSSCLGSFSEVHICSVDGGIGNGSENRLRNKYLLFLRGHEVEHCLKVDLEMFWTQVNQTN